MTMFDNMRIFTNQFRPVEGGYLYYPSRKAGGKLVSPEEYDRLVLAWQRVAGRRAHWISVGLLVLTFTAWSIISVVFALPYWTFWIVFAASVAILLGRLLQASFAARRLIASRPAIAPPRPRGEARRQARAAIGWPMVMMFLILSGAIFFSRLVSTDRTPSGWFWLIGSGSLFGAYLWLGLQKLADRQD